MYVTTKLIFVSHFTYRVILALLACLVKMAHLGKEVSLEREVCLVLWLVLPSALFKAL